MLIEPPIHRDRRVSARLAGRGDYSAHHLHHRCVCQWRGAILNGGRPAAAIDCFSARFCPGHNPGPI